MSEQPDLDAAVEAMAELLGGERGIPRARSLLEAALPHLPVVTADEASALLVVLDRVSLEGPSGTVEYPALESAKGKLRDLSPSPDVGRRA